MMNTNYQSTFTTIYRGHTIEYSNGFYIIAALPMLPFISLAAAQKYIDDLKTATHAPAKSNNRKG